MARLKWKGVPKRWTLEEARKVGTLDVQRMDTVERAELAHFLQTQLSSRSRQFEKSGTVGYALHKLVRDMAETSQKLGIEMDPYESVIKVKGKTRVLADNFAERKNPQNALAAYITLMQEFFKAKSSTVKGWREIGENQDRMLFGETVSVIPGRLYKKKQNIKYKYEIAYRMTDAERIAFWNVYDTISKTQWVPMTQKYAAGGQSDFASLWMNGDFDKSDIETALKKMQDLIDGVPDTLPETKSGDPSDPIQQGDAFGKGGYNLSGNYRL